MSTSLTQTKRVLRLRNTQRLFSAGAAIGLSLAAVLSAAPATAQRPPDAGSILRDFRGTIQPPPEPVLPPTEPAPSPPAPSPAEGRVLIKDFRITRATQFTEAELKALLRDYVDRELTLSDLRDAAFRISEYYRQHDILARAIVPRQTIRDGIVEIVVLEARLGRVNVDPAGKSRLDPDIAAGIVEHRSPPGEIVRPSRLQEGVSILNEMPGVAATGTIRAGEAEAETIMDLKLADQPLISGLTQVDNQSARFIGSQRFLGTAAINDPFGRGEQLSVLGLHSERSEYGRIAGQMPVGTSGLTLGLNASWLDFSLAPPFQALNQKGYAYTFGATAAYPVRRAPDYAVSILASYDHKQIVDQALEVNIDNRQVGIGSLGVTVTLLDTLLSGGSNNFSLRGWAGNLDREGNRDDLAIDRLTARSNGYFAKFTGGASRLQRLTDTTQLYLSTIGQVATKNLDTSEKLSLGGPYGVRAYPINEANGDDGFLTTVELRQRLPFDVLAFAFYDLGGIIVHADEWEGERPPGGRRNEYILHGAGAGASWTPRSFFQVKGTYAHAIGNNPGADANGNNADGRHTAHQVWVQATVLF